MLCIKQCNIIITCQKEEKEWVWVKYFIYSVLSQFQIFHYLRVFPPNLYSKNFRVHKKMVFFKSVVAQHWLMMAQGFTVAQWLIVAQWFMVAQWFILVECSGSWWP